MTGTTVVGVFVLVFVSGAIPETEAATATETSTETQTETEASSSTDSATDTATEDSTASEESNKAGNAGATNISGFGVIAALLALLSVAMLEGYVTRRN